MLISRYKKLSLLFVTRHTTNLIKFSLAKAKAKAKAQTPSGSGSGTCVSGTSGSLCAFNLWSLKKMQDAFRANGIPDDRLYFAVLVLLTLLVSAYATNQSVFLGPECMVNFMYDALVSSGDAKQARIISLWTSDQLFNHIIAKTVPIVNHVTVNRKKFHEKYHASNSASNNSASNSEIKLEPFAGAYDNDGNDDNLDDEAEASDHHSSYEAVDSDPFGSAKYFGACISRWIGAIWYYTNENGAGRGNVCHLLAHAIGTKGKDGMFMGVLSIVGYEVSFHMYFHKIQ